MAAMSLSLSSSSSKILVYLSSSFAFERWRRSTTNLIGLQLMRFCNSKVDIRLPKSFCSVAASSSSDSSGGSSYEVFLNFHGKDVRTNFADHLYNALVDSGIRTFRDEDELPKGNEFGPELIAAIRESRISIPIFSMNYGSSIWCLKELTEICECRRTLKQIVFPIFYKVEPRVVRHQTEVFEEAFQEYDNLPWIDQTTIQKWRNALKEVGKLDGWHSKDDTHEGKLIKLVVRTVWSELNKRPSIVSDNLIGIRYHIEKMLMLLNIESDGKKIVGIHGLGGIGKTTIARAVYSTIFHHFERHSFIENIRENAQKHGLPHLQNQLIFDILKEERNTFTSVDDGIKVLQQRFREKKVLIVLDDVDQDIHVKCLVGNREWFGIGSKIIITSRNEDVICAQEADEIYKPNVMDLDHSLQLFSHHAFRRDQPPEDFLDLSKAMIKTTGGLPLALHVIGSSLFSMKKSVWEDMLKKLQKVPNNDIMKRLKISYDGLDDEEKQMFLDAACFFIGMNKDIACYIWDGCGFAPQVGLHALCAKSLITINENDELWMHDLLRDVGREIVRQESIKEPGKRTRIWSQEEVLNVLDTQAGTSNIEGLGLYFSNISRRKCLISGKVFATMTKLRLLEVVHAIFSGNFTHSFSELRWLSWKGFHEHYVQINFQPRKLAVLDLSYSGITKEWMGWNCMKMAADLKVLTLKSCHRLTRTPDLSANQQLGLLILKDCENLVEIDTSIGYLEKLVKLDMSGCVSLVDLTTDILQLSSLERLDLRGCKSLTKLPEKLGCMISLTVLDLSGCYRLKSLPNLPRDLEVLILKNCINLVETDKSIGFPSSLVHLDISGCSSIQCISDLPSSLTYLDITGCSSIQYISDLPSNLIHLDVFFCSAIQYISILGRPSGLIYLDVRDCSSIRYISNLPSSLTNLRVSNCSSIQYISDLPSSLIHLKVISCGTIKKISSTSVLRNLETLYVEKFEGVDGKGLNSVEFFTIWGSSLKSFKKLRKVRLINCLISNIDGKGMDSLEELVIEASLPLRKISNLLDSRRLRKLQIGNCPDLCEIEGLEDCESLELLTVGDVTSLETLPDLSNLIKLRALTIYHCEKLTDIRGLDKLVSLRELKIVECKAIQRLPDLSNLKNLHRLVIIHCQNLTEIHGVDRLDSLESLDISGCESLERSLDLSNPKIKEMMLRAKSCLWTDML